MIHTLLHVFPTLAIGGQQTRFATIANCIGHDFRHRVISLDGKQDALSLLDPSLDVEVIPAPPKRLDPVPQLYQVERLTRKFLSDILITYNWVAIDWAIINRLWFPRPHTDLEAGFWPAETHRQKMTRRLTGPFT